VTTGEAESAIVAGESAAPIGSAGDEAIGVDVALPMIPSATGAAVGVNDAGAAVTEVETTSVGAAVGTGDGVTSVGEAVALGGGVGVGIAVEVGRGVKVGVRLGASVDTGVFVGCSFGSGGLVGGAPIGVLVGDCAQTPERAGHSAMITMTLSTAINSLEHLDMTAPLTCSLF